MDNLSTGEKIAGASGVALIIIMFLSWWGAPGELGDLAEAAGIDASANAWQGASFLDIIWFLTAVAAIALAVIAATATTPALPVSMSAVVAGLGILSTLLIIYRLIDPPEDAAREIGAFLGLIAAAGIAYGGWKAMEEEGTSFGEQRDRFDAGGGTAPPPPPPAPPAQ
jgi:hypothetical protein